MNFANLWPFFLLILIPGIIILYLLKQKAVDMDYSSLFLWKEIFKNTEATNPWEKFRNNLLMYLQIAITLLFIFILARPYLVHGGSDYQNVVIALDTTGSMNSLYDEGKTRFEEGIARAQNIIDNLKDDAQITIISLGKSNQIEAAHLKDKSVAKRILSDIEPTDVAGEMENCREFILSMTKTWENYQAVLITDSPVEMGDLTGYVEDVSSEGPNVSLDYVSHGEQDGNPVVLAMPTNHWQEAVNLDLNLYVDDNMVDVKSLTLNPNESQVCYFENIPSTGNAVKVEINEDDYLLQDNMGYDFLSDSTKPKILLVSEQNIFLEKAVLSFGELEFYKTNSLDNLDDTEDFDLYIFDGQTPVTLPSKGNVILLAPDKDIASVCEAEGHLDQSEITIVDSPVSEYIENYRFWAGDVTAFNHPEWAKPILKTDGQDVGYIGEYEGRTIAVIGFDIHNTDFPLNTEFPVFMNHLLSEAIKNNLTDAQVYTAGDTMVINGNPDGDDVMVKNPDGILETVSLSGMSKNYDHLNRAGVYSVSQETDGGTLHSSVVVRFPTDLESSVQKAIISEGDAQKSEVASIEGGRELKTILFWTLALLACVEWFVYLRRL